MKTDRLPTLSRCAALGALLLAVASPALAEEADGAVVRNVEVRRILVTDEGSSQAGVFLQRTAVSGEAPKMELQVLGSDTEPITIADLAVGETRTFDLGAGRSMDLTREEERLVLLLDGKEIVLPLGDEEGSMLHAMIGQGAAGAGENVEVLVLDHSAAGLGADGEHRMMFVTEDGTTQELSPGEDFSWTAAGDDALSWSSTDDGVKRRVIVKRLGGAGDPNDDVFVAQPGLALAHGLVDLKDLESLEALKGVDPEVREKVLEALREILARPMAMTMDVEVETDGDRSQPAKRKIMMRRGAPGTVQ